MRKEDKLRRGSYEIGYGKPPTAGQFVKGRSGNPKGRRKKEAKEPAAKPPPDTSTRDRVLQFAARLVGGRGGEGDVKMTAEEAVMHSQLSAAVKGSSNAQKSFLERVERFRAELNAEISEQHEFYREYVRMYPVVVGKMQKAGEQIPDYWPHPDDLIFEEGKHVMFRGGDPVEAKKNSEYVARFRDACLLQSAKDERCFSAPLAKTPVFLSSLLAALANRSLPKRLQLDERQYFWRYYNSRQLMTRELARRLREAWTELGHPEWADAITPSLKHDALERLRAFRRPGELG